eukprot:11963004-Alexandrium_andersonii.AAC.1
MFGRLSSPATSGATAWRPIYFRGSEIISRAHALKACSWVVLHPRSAHRVHIRVYCQRPTCVL